MSKKCKRLLRAVDHMDGVRYRLTALLMMAEALVDQGNAFATVTHDALRKLDAARAQIEAVRRPPIEGSAS